MSIQQFLAKRIPSAVVSGLLAMTGGLSAPVPVQTSLSVMALAAVGTFASAPASAGTAAVNNVVELSPTPPDITQAVAPNIVVTFDDSGSMADNYMGDKRPFPSTSGWSNVWQCAALIDPRVTATSDVRSSTMNGVYYNPNVIYSPPIKADGTSFPDADTSLLKVPLDGIAVNRPYDVKTLDAAATVYDNQDGVDDDTRAADLTGTTSIAPATGWYWDDTHTPKGTYKDWANWVYGTYPGNGFSSGYYSTNPKSNPPSATSNLPNKVGGAINGRYPFTGNRWSCGNSLASPMDGTTIGPDGKAYPDGGPYYYRYKSTSPQIPVDLFGNPTNTGPGAGRGVNILYTASNWEAVAVTNTTVTIDGKSVNQWQNFANWVAYYHTRNLMTRTSLSRVFGSLGAATDTGGFGNALRVAWQNLNSGNYKLPASAIITNLLDAGGCSASDAATSDPKTVQRSGAVTSAPACYRSAFFNWIFQVPASGNTPNRASTIRVGEFFQRGGAVPAVAASAGNPGSPAIAANTGATGNLEDPYWEPPRAGGGDGSELTCRQNFHMLVTDGYWNEPDPALPDPFQTSQTALASTGSKLPDGTVYSESAAESRVFWDVQGTAYPSSLANIAFNYWATNLRPDLTGQVLPYIPDTTVGVVTGATSPDLEKYFNPKNDPATWPHLVQYMVTLGVPGKLTYSNDADCSDPTNDLCKLRLGQKNSSNAIGWTKPANNNAAGIDDTWHAAINSRGAYFNAANPQNLVDQLSSILTNINARSVPVSTSALNTAVLVPGALGFTAGYSSTDWHGIFQAVAANSDGTVSTGAIWDSAQYLTDSTDPKFLAPTSRNILSSKENADGSFGGGTPFNSFSTDLDTAAAVLLASNPALAGGNDTGQERMNYLRGKRTFEGTTYRTRSSVLGAIINSQAVYVGSPSSGYRSTWPVGSPEATAMQNDVSTCVPSTPTLATCHSYEAFVKVYEDRIPAVYVGANDGMLHAFNAKQVLDGSTPPQVVPDAAAGKEIFAYVPRTVYPELANLTMKDNFKFQPTVDATPVTRDVFFASGSNTPAVTTAGWHTILVGGLRLGGRGVYALDITKPDDVTETNANQKVLWEFNSDTPAVSGVGDPADLGYTYGQPNIARLNNGKWVVLVPGGYFPDCSKSDKPANCATIAASSKGYSALFVLDAQTGVMIRELKTLTTISGVTSGGLSSVVLGDYDNDQIDDVAFAGDTNGNLWRFDLSDSNPANWQAHVTLAFEPVTQGAQPITVMPRLFPDPVTNRFIVVFGTGKYLGAGDNTSTSAVTQSIYGIRDTQAGSGTPVVKTDLQQQVLYQGLAANGVNTVRGLTDVAVPASKNGWYIDLDLTDAPGERVVVTPAALFDTNRAILTTLIPGTANPCDASIEGALMVLNAATGGSGGGLSGPGAPTAGWGTGVTGVSVVGGLVNDPPTGGSVPVASVIGGGKLLIPGLELQGKGNLNIDDAIWRRRGWRELNNDQ